MRGATNLPVLGGLLTDANAPAAGIAFVDVVRSFVHMRGEWLQF